MASSSFKLALIQLAVTANKPENIRRATELIKEAAEKGAKMVALPECFNSPYGIGFFREYAEKIPAGPTCEALSNAARLNNVYLIGGSIPEKEDDTETSKLYNTCTIWEAGTGTLMDKHRKVHLFDIDVPGKISFQESKVLTAGNKLTIVNTKLCRIGIGICYDMRFAEMAQLYRYEGCDLLVYPGAFNMTTGPAHWQILQQGRAVDNQIFVATISPARDESASYVAYGNSMVVNPWGDILVRAEGAETIVYADIDRSRAEEVQSQIPIGEQRRSDLYKIFGPTIMPNSRLEENRNDNSNADSKEMSKHKCIK